MGRVAVFFVTVLSIWAVIHLYVFWRLASVPAISKHVPWWGMVVAGLIFYVSYPVARIVGGLHWHALAVPLEFAAATWMGLLFLLFSMFVIADVLTIGGLLFRSRVGLVRTVAAISAVVLALLASVQGFRAPVLTEHVVRLKGLPVEHDGLVLVMLSDIHLGTLISKDWMGRLVKRVNAMKPDAVAVVGDLVDSDADKLEGFLPVLRELRPPLGVWAVTGNHEYYAGLQRSVQFMEDAGFKVLRDQKQEMTPGLFIAGVDDLSARRRFGSGDHPVQTAIEDAQTSATIFLSHSPLQYEQASLLGADLMLSGHTHNGQVWPFNFIVKAYFPLISGAYDVNGMQLIVSRGAGTWGPRMRLWRRSEILKIILTSGS